MIPRYKRAGWAGILTGIFLLIELAFFMASGFSGDKLTDPAQAIALIQDKQSVLRIATFFGFLGAITSVLYFTGFAAKLQSKSPSRATSVLYFGVLGSIGHGLVALSYYLGFPILLKVAETHLNAAISSWSGFLAITAGFQGLGNLLLGLTLLSAGLAIVAKAELPKSLGWVGIFAGTAAILGVITTSTVLGVIGYAAYIPSIVLAIVFNVWAGWRLVGIED